jgi:hypothetical protein
MSGQKHLILGDWFPSGTGFLSDFFWSLRCLSFFDLLHPITPLVSSNLSEMIYTRSIFMLRVVKCVLHVSMISYTWLIDVKKL